MRFLAVITAVFAAACANGGPTPPDDNEPDAGSSTPASYADVQSFCQAYAQAQCSQVVMTACGVQDASTCAAAAAQTCIADQPQGTTYVEANAPACIALVTSAYSSTTITKDQLAALASTCGTQMFSGPGAARAPCQTDYDCSSLVGLSCVVPFGQTAGKCYVPTVAQPGASCAEEFDVCTDGFYCDPMTQACTADAPVNAGCGPGYNQCADGLTCSGGGPFATCTAASPDGYPCGLDTDCSGGMCDKAASQAQGTCASQITLSPLDASCSSFVGTGD
jgi:hypothetical protein